MAKARRFQRASLRHRKDDRGTVEVKCVLIGKNNTPARGNIIRSVRIRDVKVSEVIAAIEAALLGEDQR